ncbi:hypothetical protein ACJ41O_001433 [Fusarium nematophilum]
MRSQAFEYLRILRQLPGHEKRHLVSSSPNFGTRESRHINAQYQLRAEDINNRTRFDDVIAICGWDMEWHDETAENWRSIFTLPPHSIFEIPLRCLVGLDTPKTKLGISSSTSSLKEQTVQMGNSFSTVLSPRNFNTCLQSTAQIILYGLVPLAGHI